MVAQADGSSYPTVRITDVAALAGVSPGTASKALNNTGQLRDETRQRVRKAAEQLGFAPDGRGRALSSGRSYNVGLLTTDSSGRFSIPIMQGAEDALSAGEMALLVCDTRDDPLRERHYLRSLLARGVDGIIVTGRRTDARPPIAVGVPVVYALNTSTDEADTSVVVDDAGGVATVIKHLLSLGRSRIAFISGPQRHRTAVERATAATAACPPGLVCDPLYGEWSERWGRHAADILLHSHPDLDAISCASDQIARGTCDRLRELGKSIPEEVAVTGFDNWEVMALACRPPLTTVDMELKQLGRRAATMLLEAIAGTPHRGTQVMPTRLITRESTLGS